MSDSIAPVSRIFRIGRECYIVYLGKERDDIKPFLRIGNKRDIPDDVYEVVSTTVVTDDHVGNPLLEIQNSQKVNGRYLGDTAVVGEIRKFFKSFDLPTDEVTDYRKVKDGEKRHMVWFYSSGNIHLRYDDAVIFDMDKREKADRHFIRLYEEAKAEFLRNPLRYIKQDFVGPGMVLSGSNAFWYEAGEMLALEAHPGFVARLMNDGVDPDFITTSCFDLDAETMDSHDAAVFIGFVKRMRQRRKQLRVLTTKPELQRKLRLLFPARGDVPATMDVTDVSGKKKATFRESIISRRDDAWLIHRAGLPEVRIGGTTDDGISVDVEQGILSVYQEGVETKLYAPQGCPIDFMRSSLPENQVVDKYVGLIFTQCKDHLGPGETQAAAALDKYVRMLKDDIDAGKASASPLLKQNSSAAKDGLKKAQVPDGGASWYFYSNALTVLGFLGQKAGDEHPLSKNAEPVVAALRNLLSRISEPDPVHPFWADLYIGDHPRMLYRAAKRNYVPADILSADAVNGNISDITRLDESPWEEEQERLLRLIRSLRDGGKGPLTDEQVALLQKPEQVENRKKEEKKETSSASSVGTEAYSKTDDDRFGTGGREGAGDKSAGRSGKDSSGSRGGRRTGLWILLILLLLLIGGAIAWDLSGTAPWGSILRSEDSGRDGDGGRQDGLPSDEPDTENEGTGGTGKTEGGSGSGGNDTTTGDSGDNTSAGDSGDTDGADGADGADPGDRDTEESTGIVDPDVAPRTEEEFINYSNLPEDMNITLADIHLAANEIAVLNGYKDLDFRVYTGEDPDWIYPGNVLRLPGAEDYTVRKGDTIWFLAAREVRVDALKDLELFREAVTVLDNNGSSPAERQEALENLRSISVNSRAEDMRSMAAEKLSKSQ